MKLQSLILIGFLSVLGILGVTYNIVNSNNTEYDLHVYKVDNLKILNGTVTGDIYSDNDYSSMPKENTLNITCTLFKGDKSIGIKTFTVKNVPLGDLHNFTTSGLDERANNIVVDKIIINN